MPFFAKKLSDVTRVNPIKMDHFSKFLIMNGPGQVRAQSKVLLNESCCFLHSRARFPNSFAENMLKLSVNKTKRGGLFSRTIAFIL